MMSKEIPPLPAGYTMRAPTPADLTAATDLINRCADVKHGAGRTTPVELQAEWKTPGISLGDNFRIVLDAEGRLVAYGEAWTHEQPPVDVWTWGRVDPAHHGRGIGRTLLAWQEEVATGVFDRCPADVQVTMRAGAFDRYPPAAGLFRAAGMSHVRSFYRMVMRFDGVRPDAPELPAGMALAPYRHPDDLPAVAAADEEAFRDHWGFLPRSLEEQVAHWQHFIDSDENFDPGCWLVLKDGHEIAGVCLGSMTFSEAPELGYINSLGVRRAWRKQGIGTLLLRRLFQVFYDRGKEGVVLGVDAENISGATRLYERAGMQVMTVSDVYEKVLRPGRTLSHQG